MLPMIGMREYFIGGLFNKSKKTTETVLDTTQVTKNTSKQLQENISKTVNTISSIQSLEVNFSADNMIGANEFGPGCEMNYMQKASISQNITNALMAQQLADMSTNVAKEMANNLNSELTQGSLALGESSTTDNTKITTRLENIVEREMTQKNIAETLNNTISIQDGVLNIHLRGDCAAPITYDQSFFIDTAVSNTIDAVVDAIMKDQELTEMTNDIASKLESNGVIGEYGVLLESAGKGAGAAAEGVGKGAEGVGKGAGAAAEGVGKGFGSALSGLFGGTGSIIVVIVLIFIAIGAVIYFSTSSNKSTKN